MGGSWGVTEVANGLVISFDPWIEVSRSLFMSHCGLFCGCLILFTVMRRLLFLPLLSTKTRRGGDTYYPSTWEAEAVGSRVPGQPGLHNDTVS
jgi:hypothetical protein